MPVGLIVRALNLISYKFYFITMQRPCLITDDEEILETRKIDLGYRQWKPDVLENKKPFDTFYVNTHHSKETKFQFRTRDSSKVKESLSSMVRGILDKPIISKEVILPQTDGLVHR
jgi:hypothetical protein